MLHLYILQIDRYRHKPGSIWQLSLEPPDLPRLPEDRGRSMETRGAKNAVEAKKPPMKAVKTASNQVACQTMNEQHPAKQLTWIMCIHIHNISIDRHNIFKTHNMYIHTQKYWYIYDVYIYISSLPQSWSRIATIDFTNWEASLSPKITWKVLNFIVFHSRMHILFVEMCDWDLTITQYIDIIWWLMIYCLIFRYFSVSKQLKSNP